MKKTIALWPATLMILISTGSLIAHHSLSEFDTTKPVRVKGTIVLFERVNPHTVLFVDEKREDGQIQRWAVDGPAVTQLDRMGLDKNALKIGGVVEACGYVTRRRRIPKNDTHRSQCQSQSDGSNHRLGPAPERRTAGAA